MNEPMQTIWIPWKNSIPFRLDGTFLPRVRKRRTIQLDYGEETNHYNDIITIIIIIQHNSNLVSSGKGNIRNRIPYQFMEEQK